MAAVKGKDLWSDSVGERLRSAGALSEPELEAVHAALCEECPVEPWPYGNATSINPLLVTLGPSPGKSPNRAVPDPAGRPLDLPTAGRRHPHTVGLQAFGGGIAERGIARGEMRTTT